MRYLLLLTSLTFLNGVAFGSSMVLRDSIGPGGLYTGAFIGGATAHSGTGWSTPGMVLNSTSTSQLAQVQIAIFARNGDFLPENDVANIRGYPMSIEIWTDGVEDGEDSFALNAQAMESVPGHVSIDVNTPNKSFIDVEELGKIGPESDPELFTTFLVTIDLSSFEIVLEADRQYVLGVIQDNAENFVTGSGVFRQISSSLSGFEDVFQADGQPIFLLPGYLNSQLELGIEQWAGKITVADGDFNGDGDIDGEDFITWQQGFNQTVEVPGSGADSIADGIIDVRDLTAWQLTIGRQPSTNLPTGIRTASDTSIPEPETLLLLTGSALFLSFLGAAPSRTFVRRHCIASGSDCNGP